MTEPQTFALYRFHGAGGTLLYIGVTGYLPRRLTQHNGEKEWWSGVARIEVEHYPTREAVLAAERRAIVEEQPLYNERHNPAPLSRSPYVAELEGLVESLRTAVAFLFFVVPPGLREELIAKADGEVFAMDPEAGPRETEFWRIYTLGYHLRDEVFHTGPPRVSDDPWGPAPGEQEVPF